MLKVSILGANSFIGKHLIKQLANKNDVSLSLFGRSFAPEFENLNCLQGDFTDKEKLKKALEGQDIVYHFISHTIPATSWNAPLIEIEKNLIPFLQFIELAVENGVKKICFASSGGTVYGLQQNLLDEENKSEPFSPYGIIKRSIESFLQYANQKHQLSYDIYRISNVYGEGQDIGKGLGFINTALEKIVRNSPVEIFGDGENVRDYIYVQDVAQLLTLSITKNISNSNIYNVSSNHPISLNELIELMKKVLGFDFTVQYKSSRASDNQKVVLNNAKILSDFGQINLTSLEEGIKRTYNYLKNQTSYVQKSI